MPKRVKGWFQGPTKLPTSTDEKIDRREQINWLADQYCWSFYCAVATDILVADQL